MDNRLEFIKLFKVPFEAEAYLDTFFTKDEIDLVCLIKSDEYTKDEIVGKMGLEPSKAESLIDFAYKRGVLNKKITGSGELKYIIATMGIRLKHAATFEDEIWAMIPEEARKKLADWHFEGYMKKKVDLIEQNKDNPLRPLLENENRILPLEEVLEYLKTVEEDIYLIPCDCKSINKGCDFNRNVCINFNHGINTSIDRGHGKKISKEEAIEIIKKSDKDGLMHSGEKHGICTCCGCCCYPMRASLQLGLKGKWPQALYVAELDKDKCKTCGLCANRCHFQAFTFDKKKRVLEFDSSKCWGCGVCVPTCPGKAISLKKL